MAYVRDLFWLWVSLGSSLLMTIGNLVADRLGHKQNWRLLGILMGILLVASMFVVSFDEFQKADNLRASNADLRITIGLQEKDARSAQGVINELQINAREIADEKEKTIAILLGANSSLESSISTLQASVASLDAALHKKTVQVNVSSSGAIVERSEAEKAKRRELREYLLNSVLRGQGLMTQAISITPMTDGPSETWANEIIKTLQVNGTDRAMSVKFLTVPLAPQPIHHTYPVTPLEHNEAIWNWLDVHVAMLKQFIDELKE